MSSDEEAYNITCNRCGESFVAADRSARRICEDCFSAVMQEDLDRVLEEHYPDYEGKYDRIVICCKCGEKYLESKLGSNSDDKPKLCKTCAPVSNFPSDEEIEEMARKFSESLKQEP